MATLLVSILTDIFQEDFGLGMWGGAYSIMVSPLSIVPKCSVMIRYLKTPILHVHSLGMLGLKTQDGYRSRDHG